jgi:ureidoglycolate hydrolase
MSAALPQTEAGKPHPPRLLTLELATPESFAAYGQVIMPGEDGVAFGEADAQLDLTKGVPRFYSMQLTHRGRRFSHITRHRMVTQCLGAMMGTSWMLGVAEANTGAAPQLETLKAFFVPGDRFVKLHKGTWHAGPYFDASAALFYNLELADTNIVDHDTCDLKAQFGVEFEFDRLANPSWGDSSLPITS